MAYIDYSKLEAITHEGFEGTRPYPFANPEGLLTDEGFEALYTNLPDLSLFEESIGKTRRAGQTPHDRYSLEYTPDTRAPEPWKAFIDELCGDRYRQNIARLFGARKIEFRFHWHYTPPGCSVSPHTDSPREHGSHLFYFNGPDDWEPDWGGDTLILDDGGRLDYNSAPKLEEFDGEIACKHIGNFSAIIKRTDHAWHAVRPIECPEGKLRKLFIVVVNPDAFYWKVRDRLIGKQKQAF